MVWALGFEKASDGQTDRHTYFYKEGDAEFVNFTVKISSACSALVIGTPFDSISSGGHARIKSDMNKFQRCGDPGSPVVRHKLSVLEGQSGYGAINHNIFA
jgi:hypothetical protein